jgi:hypothetical protein
MPLDNPRPGYNWAAEFMASSIPWITGSVELAANQLIRYDFNFVTRFVTVRNVGTGTMFFGFTQRGCIPEVGNRLKLDMSESYTADFKIKSLFLTGTNQRTKYDVIAGLTAITASMMPVLSGSNSLWQGIG